MFSRNNRQVGRLHLANAEMTANVSNRKEVKWETTHALVVKAIRTKATRVRASPVKASPVKAILATMVTRAKATRGKATRGKAIPVKATQGSVSPTRTSRIDRSAQ